MNRTGRALAVAVVPMVSLTALLIPGVAQAARGSDDTRVTGFGRFNIGSAPNTNTASFSIRDVSGGLYHATGEVEVAEGTQRALGQAYCVTSSTATSGTRTAAIGLHVI